jgi:hypothetical protein
VAKEEKKRALASVAPLPIKDPRRADQPVEFQTLGPIVTAWIEDNCVIPDGEANGRAVLADAGDEAVRRRLLRGRCHDQAGGRSRGGQLIRPQKWGKGPFSAALICAEAVGPVLPVWEDGKLVGGRGVAVDPDHGGVRGPDGERLQRACTR